MVEQGRTTQYNVAVKVLDPSREQFIQQSLVGYRALADESGNLKDTRFSREDIPYVGEVVVVKTLNYEVAQIAYEVLGGIEGLVVLPITECCWEEDKERVARGKREKITRSIRERVAGLKRKIVGETTAGETRLRIFPR